MRVLVGVDGSDGSLAAVRFIGRLLCKDRDRIFLYYSPPSVAIRERHQRDAATLARVEAALADSVFERSRVEVPSGLRESVETVTGIQKARYGLLAAVDEYRSDLVVVGSRGLGMVERLALGSVSRAVAHAATVPVLIVRDSPEATPSSGFRLLMACDRSESCADAKKLVSRFTWPDNTSGEVLTVFESLVGQIPEWLEEELRANEAETMHMGHFEPRVEDKQRVREELERWCQDLPTQFQGCKQRVAEGKPAQQILNVLKSDTFDLVIVGARRLGPLGRAFLGSTSDRVMTNAPCSVLIVRQHEQP